MIVRELVTLLGFQVEEAVLKNAEKQVESMTSKLTTLATRAAVAFGAYKLGGFVRSSIEAAARVETLDIVLENIAKRAGKTREEMSGLVSELQETGIAGIEAREVLLRMSQAGLDMSLARPLARLAQDAAVVGGTNSSQALESIIHGVVTRQPEVLRQYGIQVDFEKAFSGKAGKSMTQQQKVIMALNLVMAQGEKIAGSYEAAMGTAGKKMGSLTRLVDDFKASFGATFLKTFGKIIDDLSEFYKQARKVVEADVDGTFSDMGKAFHGVYTVLKIFLMPVLRVLWELVKVVTGAIAYLTDNVGYFLVALAGIAAAFVAAKWAAIVVMVQRIIAVFRAATIWAALMQLAIFAVPLLIGALVSAIILLGEDLYRWFKGQKSAIGEWLGSWKSAKDMILGWLDNLIEKTSEFLKKIPFVGKSLSNEVSAFRHFTQTSQAGGAKPSKVINVDSKINLQVPQGTTEEQRKVVDEVARRAVREEYERELRHVFSNNLAVE